jgi:hypothetical protein
LCAKQKKEGWLIHPSSTAFLDIQLFLRMKRWSTGEQSPPKKYKQESEDEQEEEYKPISSDVRLYLFHF